MSILNCFASLHQKYTAISCRHNYTNKVCFSTATMICQAKKKYSQTGLTCRLSEIHHNLQQLRQKNTQPSTADTMLDCWTAVCLPSKFASQAVGSVMTMVSTLSCWTLKAARICQSLSITESRSNWIFVTSSPSFSEMICLMILMLVSWNTAIACSFPLMLLMVITHCSWRYSVLSSWMSQSASVRHPSRRNRAWKVNSWCSGAMPSTSWIFALMSLRVLLASTLRIMVLPTWIVGPVRSLMKILKPPVPVVPWSLLLLGDCWQERLDISQTGLWLLCWTAGLLDWLQLLESNSEVSWWVKNLLKAMISQHTIIINPS